MFEQLKIDLSFYANRVRSYDEIMPWQHLDYYVTRDFLIKENKLAHEEKTTSNCREKCTGCGVAKAVGGACFGKN